MLERFDRISTDIHNVYLKVAPLNLDLAELRDDQSYEIIATAKRIEQKQRFNYDKHSEPVQ